MSITLVLNCDVHHFHSLNPPQPLELYLFCSIFISSSLRMHEFIFCMWLKSCYVRLSFDMFFVYYLINQHFKRNLKIKIQFDLQTSDLFFQIKHLVATFVDFKGIGGVLFIFGSSLGAYFFGLYSLSIDFVELLLKYSQVFIACLALCSLFLGMKNSSPKRQPAKKKGPKAKTT
ncbi:hypothetical protein MKW92_012410 [Papaver armeniacum]|nr:hypothetical protein MKW92_012410 [Papaver armeniacum]